jgi:uncharacterized protein (DUF1697 family)
MTVKKHGNGARLVAMLRGINVSGRNIIKMADLRKVFAKAGMKNVSTYIQSGNVVFDAQEGAGDIEKILEAGIRDRFGSNVNVIVRNAVDLSMALSGVPADLHDETKTYFMFFKEKVNIRTAMKKFPHEESNDVLSIFPGHAVLYCHNGYGKTKLSNNFVERVLNVTATTRNHRTVCKLIDMAEK